MKKILVALCAVPLVLTGAAGPSQADPPKGGSCNLSANWKVSGSATWYGTDLAYAVISSPGALTFPSTFVVGYSPTESPALSQQGSAPPWVYRADFNSSGSQTHVTFQIYGGAGACNFTLTK